MARVTKLSNNKKRQIEALVEQAASALSARRTDVCEQLCLKIEAIQPGNADVANIRGIVCVQAGDKMQAEQLFVQAINAAPKRAEFHNNLGKLYLSQKLFTDAAERYRSAMHYDRNSLDLKLGYCASLVGMGEPEKALPILEQLRSKKPNPPDLFMALFYAYQGLGRIDDALACLDKLIAGDADHFDARFQRGQLFMQQGRMQEAEDELHAALALRPDYSKAYSMLVEMKKFTSDDDADKKTMEALYQQSAPGSVDRVYLCFALGKANEDLKHFDEAFAYFEEGNTLRQRYSDYNLDAELAHLEAVMSFYTPEVLQCTSSLDDDRPVFIVGMPRSGSTLTEQILAAHPDVGSRGEWNAFEESLLDRGQPDQPLTLEEMTAFSAEQWRETGQAYLDRLDDDASKRIIDKTLINFRLIGAIHCALPHARIIHVRRHPLDNCLSIYRANLSGGHFDFGYNLGRLGYYYRMYQRLMQHWRTVLPAGVMYEMDYEELVANQEDQTRRLLEFCDLDWNDACLQFNKAPTVVATASVAQVRREMYSDAVARWKRYEKHLQPLIKILGVTA
ncbi:tetratricopeptide repeat-containing sulfotransferase family protein [Mariprofundus ferrooxydans]|uniref:tetratricopeptide repeat-containing sulfotransferase family protein n=1 Tax=Mariprofundus ferrooxydans TaxID=314344 RepID=UPI0014313693|nr:tetratricopeptide repeat-containing sulfotransferase family protein [Mariprofundus ferrooxydans]